MRITKVYTKVGDRGTTRLVGGSEARKDSARVEAYGAVDELNAWVGMIRTLLLAGDHESGQQLEPLIERIQHDLFDLGALLATPADSEWQPPGVSKEATQRLESSIDQLNDQLEPLIEFILPGGGNIGAHFHIARTVCRRAERRVVTLFEEELSKQNEGLIYLNRLSDWLFVAGRWAAKALNERELTWQKNLD